MSYIRLSEDFMEKFGTVTEQFEFRSKFELFRPTPTLDTYHSFIKSNVNAFYSIVMN